MQASILDFLKSGGKRIERGSGSGSSASPGEAGAWKPSRLNDIMRALGRTKLWIPEESMKLMAFVLRAVRTDLTADRSLKQDFDEREFLWIAEAKEPFRDSVKAFRVGPSSDFAKELDMLLKRMEDMGTGAVEVGHGRPWNYIPNLFGGINKATHVAGIVMRGFADAFAVVSNIGAGVFMTAFGINTIDMKIGFMGCAWYAFKSGGKWSGAGLCGTGLAGALNVQLACLKARYCLNHPACLWNPDEDSKAKDWREFLAGVLEIESGRDDVLAVWANASATKAVREASRKLWDEYLKDVKGSSDTH